MSVGVSEVLSSACCFRVHSVSGSDGDVIVCLFFQGTQCQCGYISVSGREWSCHRLPAVSGWIVSVGVSGGVIVCLLIFSACLLVHHFR